MSHLGHPHPIMFTHRAHAPLTDQTDELVLAIDDVARFQAVPRELPRPDPTPPEENGTGRDQTG